MFCSRCGRELEERFSFCPGCGSSVVRPDTVRPADNYPRTYPQYAQPAWSPQQKPRSRSTMILAISLVVVLLGAGLAVSVALLNEDDEKKTVTMQLDNGDYLTLSGDFLPERNILTVRFDPDRIAFVLNSDIASDHTYYYWKLFDRDHSAYNTPLLSPYTGNVLEKSEATLYLLVSKPGVFTVSVVCYTGTSGNYREDTAYTGTVGYYTDVTIDHTWTYNGKEQNLSVTFGYAAYEEYRNKNVDGRWPFAQQYTSFVIYDDPVVVDIAEKLRVLYGPASPGDPGLANFVLSYVQNCYGYPPYSNKINADAFLYGSMEYFAYPLETIFMGQGDCEDTSILVDAILHALGYDTAILVLPEHAMAGVALNGYSPNNGYPYEVLSQTVDGKTYYAGETTISFTRAFGLAPIDGNGDHPFSYYLEEANNKRTYGFYVVA